MGQTNYKLLHTQRNTVNTVRPSFYLSYAWVVLQVTWIEIGKFVSDGQTRCKARIICPCLQYSSTVFPPSNNNDNLVYLN